MLSGASRDCRDRLRPRKAAPAPGPCDLDCRGLAGDEVVFSSPLDELKACACSKSNVRNGDPSPQPQDRYPAADVCGSLKKVKNHKSDVFNNIFNTSLKSPHA